MKPQPGAGGYYVAWIYTSEVGPIYGIRLWDGGMQEHRQFCLDFCDFSGVPINLPEGFELWPAVTNIPPFRMYGQFLSVEHSMGYNRNEIAAGEERWIVPEGVHITVKWNKTHEVTFAVPMRFQAGVRRFDYVKEEPKEPSIQF